VVEGQVLIPGIPFSTAGAVVQSVAHICAGTHGLPAGWHVLSGRVALRLRPRAIARCAATSPCAASATTFERCCAGLCRLGLVVPLTACAFECESEEARAAASHCVHSTRCVLHWAGASARQLARLRIGVGWALTASDQRVVPDGFLPAVSADRRARPIDRTAHRPQTAVTQTQRMSIVAFAFVAPLITPPITPSAVHRFVVRVSLHRTGLRCVAMAGWCRVGMQSPQCGDVRGWPHTACCIAHPAVCCRKPARSARSLRFCGLSSQ
jgi:hypothetical protein